MALLGHQRGVPVHGAATARRAERLRLADQLGSAVRRVEQVAALDVRPQRRRPEPEVLVGAGEPGLLELRELAVAELDRAPEVAGLHVGGDEGGRGRGGVEVVPLGPCLAQQRLEDADGGLEVAEHLVGLCEGEPRVDADLARDRLEVERDDPVAGGRRLAGHQVQSRVVQGEPRAGLRRSSSPCLRYSMVEPSRSAMIPSAASVGSRRPDSISEM